MNSINIAPMTSVTCASNGVQTVTVYASSGLKVDKSYYEAAFSLGAAIARRGWIQCNGGGFGLMEACTDGAKSVGGIVDCVILDSFTGPMKKFRSIVTSKTMPERRKSLYVRGDAFVSLPGGLGTLEEVAELISWRQLEFHTRCVVLLNTNGFYNSLVEFIERGIEEHFIAPAMRTCIIVADTVDEAVQAIESYEPVEIHKNLVLSGIKKEESFPESTERNRSSVL